MGARRVSQGITATQASHTVIHSAGVLPPMASRSQDVFDEPPLTQEERARVEQVVEILSRARQRQQERIDAALTPPDRRRVQAQRTKIVSRYTLSQTARVLGVTRQAIYYLLDPQGPVSAQARRPRLCGLYRS